MKKFVAVVLLMALLCSLNPISVSANNSAYTQSDYYDYAQNQTSTFIGSEFKNLDQSLFYLSQGYKVQDAVDDSIEIFFIFYKGKCVGETYVYVLDGNLTASFFVGDNSYATEAYRNHCDISIISNGSDTIDFVVHPISKKGWNDNSEKIQLTSIISNNGVTSYGHSFSSNYGYMDVPHVANTSINGVGICWCATVASICAYRTGVVKSASQLYYAVIAQYPSSVVPSGTTAWVSRAYHIYGITATTSNAGLNFTQAKSIMMNNIPIYAGVDYGTNDNHAVIVCGYTISYSGGGNVAYYYRIHDSNRTGYYSATVSSLTATNFSYSNGTVTYNNWHRTAY